MKRVFPLFLLLCGWCVSLLTAPLSADDWPQWRGPQRDNIWRETGILDRFPEGGPEVLWRKPVAGGYAGVAVADGRIFLTDFVKEPLEARGGEESKKEENIDAGNITAKGIERVHCLDEATGKTIWTHEYPVTYYIAYPAGPRCTPTVEDDRVYTLGAEGNLYCFRVTDGKILWSRNFKEDFKTKTATWGYASHPLIDGDKLICVVGTDVAHAAAFDKFTGKELWRTGKAPQQGYCPPVIYEMGGRRQLILMKPDGMYGADPETGKIFWEAPYEASFGSIIMTPVQIDDYLYVGGFKEKNLLLKMAKDKPEVEVLWRDKARHGIAAVNVQPFLADGLLYGFDERGDLRAIEFPSGEIRWSSPGPFPGRRRTSATAFLNRNEDRFWMFAETGDLIIAQISPEGYEELDRVHLIKPTNFAYGREVVWCPPAFANKKMFVRNDEELICVNLSADQ